MQIGHGVTIGRNVRGGEVGIAGSTDIEDDVVFGGQVGVGGHLDDRARRSRSASRE